jgi:hypothetical protein
MKQGASWCDAQLLLLEQKRKLYHVAKDKQIESWMAMSLTAGSTEASVEVDAMSVVKKAEMSVMSESAELEWRRWGPVDPEQRGCWLDLTVLHDFAHWRLCWLSMVCTPSARLNREVHSPWLIPIGRECEESTMIVLLVHG